MRSPKIAPPENGLDGSMQMIPIALAFVAIKEREFVNERRFSGAGEPVMPMIKALPVFGKPLSSVPPHQLCRFRLL
jgi:hypothetical protein